MDSDDLVPCIHPHYCPETRGLLKFYGRNSDNICACKCDSKNKDTVHVPTHYKCRESNYSAFADHCGNCLHCGEGVDPGDLLNFNNYKKLVVGEDDRECARRTLGIDIEQNKSTMKFIKHNETRLKILDDLYVFLSRIDRERENLKELLYEIHARCDPHNGFSENERKVLVDIYNNCKELISVSALLNIKCLIAKF